MSPQGGEQGKASDAKTGSKGKGIVTAEEELRASKGKGKMAEPVDVDDEEEDEEDFDEDAASSSADDKDEEGDEQDDEEDEEQEEQPPAKKAKVESSSSKPSSASKAGPSSSKPQATKKRRKGGDDEDEDDGSPEIVAHASGDEVDTSLIIPGGRRARKGRPQIGQQAQKYKYQQKLADSDEDSW